jgi:hypothetical protein
MAKQVSLTRTPGQTLYAFPSTDSLANWTLSRIQLVEGTGANTGRYTASLDETISSLWYFFEGATQPANWGLSKGYFDLIPEASFTVQPSIGYGVREVAGDVIEIATDAARVITRTVYDEDENEVTLPTSARFVICDPDGKLVTTLTPSVSGASYSVTIPRSICKKPGDLFFAFRRDDSSYLDYDSGTLRIVYVAFDPA